MQHEKMHRWSCSAANVAAPTGYAASANGNNAVFATTRAHGLIAGSSRKPHQHVLSNVPSFGVNAKPMDAGVGAVKKPTPCCCARTGGTNAGRIDCWFGAAPRPYCAGAAVGAVEALVDATPALTAAVPSAAAPLPINLATPATPFATALKSSDVDFGCGWVTDGTPGLAGAGGYCGGP